MNKPTRFYVERVLWVHDEPRTSIIEQQDSKARAIKMAERAESAIPEGADMQIYVWERTNIRPDECTDGLTWDWDTSQIWPEV